jgi:dTDP-4-dehydrorhamnose 3,5-epimerase
VIQPKVHYDSRGFFYESFNKNFFSSIVNEQLNFVQDNHSFSTRGVIRGLHYQSSAPQAKLVRVCHGKIFDVVVDVRKKSKTFGQWFGVELSAENKKQLWIPEGFAHGFLTLSKEADVIYKTTSYWDPSSEQCLIWNDSFVNIKWPNLNIPLKLSKKDLVGVNFSSLNYCE